MDSVSSAKKENGLLKTDRLYYNKNGIIVRNMIRSDVDFLRHVLKKEDIEEIYYSHNHTSEQALESSLHDSMISMTIVNGNPIGCFGINPQGLLGNKAVIWFLSSDDLYKISKRFLKNSRRFIDYFLEFYPYLHNYIHVGNRKTIKWLRFCGASFDNPVYYGKENKKFVHFYFMRDDR